MSNAIYKKDLHDVALAVAQGSKDYTDKEIKKTKNELITLISKNTVETEDHTNELTYQITAPSGAKLLQLMSVGGNAVKYNPTFASDDTTALVKTMPSVVYDFDCSVVYGNSEVSENLNAVADVPITTAQGVTYKVENGIVTIISGTSNNTTGAWIKLPLLNPLPSGTYTILDFGSDGGVTSVETLGLCNSEMGIGNNWLIAKYGIATTKTFTSNINYFVFKTVNGVTYNNATFKPMLVKGSTAPTEWKQGFEGIHNFEWTGVKVEGQNLFNANNFNSDGGKWSYSKTTASFTATADGYDQKLNFLNITLPAGTYSMCVDNTNYSNLTLVTTLGNQQVTSSIHTFTYNEEFTIKSVGATLRANNTYKFMLIRGNTQPTSYVPYIAPTTLPIDLSTILYNGSPLFEGNSLKAVNDVKDSITPYKATKKLGYVDLGTLEWTLNSSFANVFNTTSLTGIIKGGGLDVYGKLLMANYSVETSGTVGNVDMSCAVGGTEIFYVHDNRYSTAEAFKTAMSGVYLVYELKTPIEVSIDWSAILRNIQGHSNGSITANNTYDMPVHSEIRYNSIIQETLCPSVSVDGANRFDKDTYTITNGFSLNDDGEVIANSSSWRVINYYMPIRENTTYTLSGTAIGAANWGTRIAFYDENHNQISQIKSSNITTTYTFTTPSGTRYWKYSWAIVSDTSDWILNEGSTALSYRPYKETITRNLPTITSDGYGVNADAHNLRVFSDYEGNAVNKRYTNVNKDTLDSYNYTYESSWGAGADFYINSVDTTLMKKPSDNDTTANVMTRSYTNVSRNTMYDNATDMVMSLLTGGAFKFRNNLYIDATIFKTAMANEPLYYELADDSKAETDIDDFDFFFDVEEGDIITFNNPYAQQVYATYSFIIKEAKSNE